MASMIMALFGFMIVLNAQIYSQNVMTTSSTDQTAAEPSMNDPTDPTTEQTTGNATTQQLSTDQIQKNQTANTEHATATTEEPAISTATLELPTNATAKQPPTSRDDLTTAEQPAPSIATTQPFCQAANETHLQCGHRVFVIECNPEAPNCNSLPLHEIARNVSNATQIDNSTYVTININSSIINLTEAVEFSGIYSLSILGSSSGNSMLVCENTDIGILIQSIENVELAGITISGCGLLKEITTKLHIASALHICSCGTVMISDITVKNNIGSGLNIQKNQREVSVADSNFINNTLTAPSNNPCGDRLLGGNGVTLYITPKEWQQSYNFLHCRFVGNVAKSECYRFLLPSSHNDSSVEGRGRGAGMRLTFERNTTYVNVSIIDSTFERNQAFLGAGLSAEMEGDGYRNMLSINNTRFVRNGCQATNAKSRQQGMGFGGGALFSFENLYEQRRTDNHYSIHLHTATFDSNCAELGGGAYFFSDRSTTPNSNIFAFENSMWTENYARTGSAVGITPNIFIRAQEGYFPMPLFRNCNFTHNTIEPMEELTNSIDNKQSYGSGTLYSSLLSLKFESFNLFEDNIGSGLIVINGIANFIKSSAIFARNRGVQGGAIFLIGTAALEVGPNQDYHFTGNIASDKGGAIYSYLIDDTDFIVSQSCFIQFRDPAQPGIIYPSSLWSASLTFNENKAMQQLGHAIYATSIIPCQVTNSFNNSNINSRYQLINQDAIFQPPGVIVEDRDKSYQIATEGNRFDLNSTLLRIIPGELGNLGVTILDDFGKNVSSILTAYVRNGKISIESQFSCITEHTIKLRGRVGERGQLVLQTIGSRKISLTIDIELLQCPPGFRSTTEQVCICDSSSFVGVQYCNNYNAFLTPGFWAGYIQNGTILATALCPVGFCDYSTDSMQEEEERVGAVKLPKDGALLEEAICGDRRRGILCGKCRVNFTTYYHSPNLNCFQEGPYDCKLGWLFYFLSELLPVTFLFLFVLVMNVSLTTGAINGFILFSQLLDTLQIDASGVIKFPQSITFLSQGYKIIYGFFNLDVFATDSLSFCLWKDATALGMLAFKYVTVVYSLLLVLLVILFMRYSGARCCGKRYSISALRNSVIHGLSGFLVLCYGQCIRVSFSILYNQVLVIGDEQVGKGGGEANTSTLALSRVLLNGNIKYFGHEHLPFAIPALFVLVLIGVLPPLVLLAYPLLNKVFIWFKLENSRLASFCLYPANKLKPLLDSFQGSFKDNLRFFAGIYFFYRWVAVATYAAITYMSLFYTVVQALLIAMLVLHSMSQPYLKSWHNILDSLLLFNLTLINGITMLNYYWVRVDVGRDSDETNHKIAITSSIQLVLIYLPFLYAMMYVCSCLFIKIFCKGVKEEPEKGDFVLKKIGKRIYRSSFLSSDTTLSESFAESLPYRLVDGEEGNPFEESAKEEDHVIDTYL